MSGFVLDPTSRPSSPVNPTACPSLCAGTDGRTSRRARQDLETFLRLGRRRPDPLVPHPAEAAAASLAKGAKEGHGTSRAGVDLPGLSPPPRSGARPGDPTAGGRTPRHRRAGSRVDRGRYRGGRPSGATPGRCPTAGLIATPRRSSRVSPPAPTAEAKCSGHGTFIAGIIRQLAPEATVLSLPVMALRGSADDRCVLDALEWLMAHRVEAAAAGRSDLAIRGRGEPQPSAATWNTRSLRRRTTTPPGPARPAGRARRTGRLRRQVTAPRVARVPRPRWPWADDRVRTALKWGRRPRPQQAPRGLQQPRRLRHRLGAGHGPGQHAAAASSPSDPATCRSSTSVEKVIEDPNLQLTTYGPGGVGPRSPRPGYRASDSGHAPRGGARRPVLRRHVTARMRERATAVWDRLAPEFAPPAE